MSKTLFLYCVSCLLLCCKVDMESWHAAPSTLCLTLIEQSIKAMHIYLELMIHICAVLDV
jgi:hypothetical protein